VTRPYQNGRETSIGSRRHLRSGTKELIALDYGHRESTESWLDLLRGCKRRGMAAPVLAVGDGALGFWSAVREVFPETSEQRYWWYKIGNVLNALPKSAQPGAKKALAEIWNAEDKDHAQAAANVFAADYGTKWPKAAAKITDDLDVLLAFYDYPAEHWIHLRTINPIESTFATVRLRQRVSKGPGSRAAGVAMAFKLIESAQTRWRAVNAPHLVALVRAGAVFKSGKLIERPDGSEVVISKSRDTPILSPIALPARRRRACRLGNTRFRSR
jgi:putative transposase